MDKIEGVIRQRILDKMYDDPVEPKFQLKEAEKESLNFTKSTIGNNFM